ncbi:alpha/beta hydrolase domain-containing protein [Gordonia terrae]|uniref:alpha/beta hydrolase domain-containing protein n=1 Tax=Gordonia hongkongensis TaxID=1701090 RepID=UPI0022B2BA1B|nr:alpha/beta hydrolase domain-containing protein [Gordonia terrae]
MRFHVLQGGNGCSLLSASPLPDLAAAGYTDIEYAASGIADAVVGDTGAPPAEFTTRVVVRRPAEPATFSGCVVVEWLNVSSGADAAPEYSYVAAELVRSGHAWIGVSAQFVGVEGGTGSVGVATGAPQSLAAKDPERYAGLRHPGDAYCYDIFSSVGRAVRETAVDGHPLEGLQVSTVLAIGESQSAMALTTYVNAIGPDAAPFDGYLIHSRAAAGLPAGEVGSGIDVATVFGREPTTIRTDLDAPVFVVQTETDVLTNFRYHTARQPDSDRLRVWEMAGTSHADLHQVGDFEEFLGCPDPVNRGQQRFVLRAALRHLRSWADGGDPPPAADPLALRDAGGADPVFELDDIGNVRGGVRTPCVDAPTQVLSGIVADPVSRICLLFGTTFPVPADALAARYGTRDEYEKHYRNAADAAIAGGFVLAEDRDELLADANPDLIPN